MSPASLAPSPARELETRVLEVRPECPGVATIRLSVPADFSFRPGMWIMLHFPDSPKVSRAYSMASSPLQKGHIEISLARVGGFSERLCGLREGDSLRLKGPYGKWVFQDGDVSAVLISGGTGIAPFRSMWRYVRERGLPARLTVLYSCKTPSDMLYREELKSLTSPDLRIYTTITRAGELPPGERWDGPTGRLSLDVIRREVPDFAQASYYLCGPNAMVSDLSVALLEGGVPRSRVRTEKWGDF